MGLPNVLAEYKYKLNQQKKSKSLVRTNIPWNALKTFKRPSGKFWI